MTDADELLVVRPVTACPCCHGKQFLFVHDEQYPDEPPQRVYCCHCMGKGFVHVERERGTG